MELHLVHKKSDAGTEEPLGVVGIFFDTIYGGNEFNPFIEGLHTKIVHKSTAKIHSEDMSLLLSNLLQEVSSDDIINYKGGLTTPPCNETVEWIILPDIQPISTE